MKSCNRVILSVLLLLGACTDVRPDITATASPSLSAGGVVVSPATGWGDTGVTGAARADGSVDWCCTTWVVPLPVQAGDVVSSVSVPVRDNGASNGFATGGNTVTVMVGTPSADGSTFNVLQYQTTDGSGNQVSLLLSFATPHTVATGENLQLRLKAQTPGLTGGTPATHNSWTGAATVAAPVVQQQALPCTETSTTAQIYQCESNAQTQCANLGFSSNDYCFQAFAQSCSCHDKLTAQATCAHHPEVAHNINTDGSCSLVWR